MNWGSPHGGRRPSWGQGCRWRRPRRSSAELRGDGADGALGVAPIPAAQFDLMHMSAFGAITDAAGSDDFCSGEFARRPLVAVDSDSGHVFTAVRADTTASATGGTHTSAMQSDWTDSRSADDAADAAGASDPDRRPSTAAECNGRDMKAMGVFPSALGHRERGRAPCGS